MINNFEELTSSFRKSDEQDLIEDTLNSNHQFFKQEVGRKTEYISVLDFNGKFQVLVLVIGKGMFRRSIKFRDFVRAETISEEEFNSAVVKAQLTPMEIEKAIG